MTDSHRRALVAAMHRKQFMWTAIFEDDAVPVDPEAWSEAFLKQWEQVPKEALIVRLGSCSFESEVGPIHEEPEPAHWGQGEFSLVRKRWWTDGTGARHYYAGGCSTGYLVHKSVISKVLGIFPCCCSFDCCLARQLLQTEAESTFDGDQTAGAGEFGKWWGARHLVDMQSVGARASTAGFTPFNQSGILVQDHRQDSERRDTRENTRDT